MAMTVTTEDLLRWNDPDHLLEAIVRLRREDLPGFRTELRSLLDHEDPDVREHALRRLAMHLKDVECHEKAVELLRDPEPNLRRAAAHAVTSTSTSASRDADTRELLAMLNETDAPGEVRRAAYESLLLLHGRKDLPAGNRPLDLQRDVDWRWIQQLQELSP
jgi:hypothetical protein